MTNITIENLFIILFMLLILSAFFSGAETSLMSVNRYRLKHKFKTGDKISIIESKPFSKNKKFEVMDGSK